LNILETTKGYLYVSIAAVLWASSGAAGKALFESGVSPFDLVQIRVTLASLMLLIIFVITDRALLRIRSRDLPYFLLQGSVVMALVQITYFYAISKIQVVAAVLLQYLSPIIVAVFSMLFWGERFTVWKLISLILAIGGCYLVVGGYNLELLQMNKLGLLAGLAAAVSYSAYALLGEWGMHRYSPWTVVFYSLAFAALTWHVVYPPFKYLYSDYSYVQWLLILHIVIFGTILPFGLYFVGINYIRSTRALITATLEPIFAGLFAFVFLGESLQMPQLAGVAFVLFAILLLQTQRESDSLAPHVIRNKI
jgi:drug/metabolite transporter (DMT)-like permease